MLEGLLRSVAVGASAIVLLSFTLFALDETRGAARQSADAVAALDATRISEPSLAALLYGFGLSFLARYSRGRA